MKKIFFYSAIVSSATLFSLAAIGQSAPTAVPGKILEPVVPKTSKPIQTTTDDSKYKPVPPVFNDLVTSTTKTIKEDKNQQQSKAPQTKQTDTRTPYKSKVEYKEIPPAQVDLPVMSPVAQDVKKVTPQQQKQ